MIDCATCGGPCKLPDWARDSSFVQNNPGKMAGVIARNHRWFLPKRLAEVEKVRAEIRAMSAGSVFPCSRCGRYAFPEPVVCHWCGIVENSRPAETDLFAAT